MCHYYHVITVCTNGEICTLFRLTVNGGQVERRLPGLVAAVHAAAATAIVAEEDLEAAVGVGRRGGDVHQRLPLRVGLNLAAAARGRRQQVRHHLPRVGR